jgi:formylglycine-generating enzyme
MEQIEARLEGSVRHGLRVVLCCLLVVVATSPVPAQTAKAAVGDTLAVVLPAGSAGSDFDGNGKVGFGDYLLFAQAYQTDHAEYDLSGDGVVDFRDFWTFVEFYGQVVYETRVEMVFTYIPNGTFTMGSPSSESGHSSTEGPQHEVTISKGFYLGKYEVTQGQWQAVMSTTPWAGRDYVQVSPSNPAVYVSWNDAQDFVQRLNAAAGDSLYRLPTEAEWEYACRAGTTKRLSFGDDESKLTDYAWYDVNTWNVGERYAHQVGTKLANPWGLFDMHGNVWEWCLDWYGYGYSTGAQTDPPGPVSGSHRVIRGGSFRDVARLTRSTLRGAGSPGYRYFGFVGFRLLRRAQ